MRRKQYGEHTITIRYDMDVSDVPVHVANYMIGIVLAEHLAWSDVSIN